MRLIQVNVCPSKPTRVSYDNGYLFQDFAHQTLRLRAWPPALWRRTTGRWRRHPFELDVYAARNFVQAREHIGLLCGEPLVPAVDQETQSWRAFLAEYPPHILDALCTYGTTPPAIHELLAELDATADLIESSPALAYMIAHKRGFCGDEIEASSAELVAEKQHAALGDLGFPSQKSVARIVRKVAACDVSTARLLSLRWACQNPQLRKALGHRPNIGGDLLDDLAKLQDTLPAEFTATLVAQGAKSLENHVRLARDIERLNALIPAYERPPQFESIAHLRQVHDELTMLVNDVGAWRFEGIGFGLAPWPSLPDKIEPISDIVALAHEGRRMGHCCVSYAPEIACGVVYFFRVLEPHRATLSIRKGRNGWRLDEISGPYNATPSAATVQMAHAWARQHSSTYKHRETLGQLCFGF